MERIEGLAVAGSLGNGFLCPCLLVCEVLIRGSWWLVYPWLPQDQVELSSMKASPPSTPRETFHQFLRFSIDAKQEV